MPLGAGVPDQGFCGVSIEVHKLYGMTECTGPATVIDGENAIKKAGSAGGIFS
ncbi:MAG: hypothetical protein R2875_01300 [Desulfobacterales bacterium]